MVNLSNKQFAAIILFFSILAVVAVLIAINFMGWGTALSGLGGPIVTGIYKGVNAIPTWISTGGWPSLAVGIIIFVVVWPLIVGYVFERKQVIATLKGAKSMQTSEYTNTMNLEPQEPERAPQPNPQS